jgi:hypothetical protein
LDGAFLIVQREPVPFEVYRPTGTAEKREVLYSGFKQANDIIRFETFAIRANCDGLEAVPEMEILDGMPVEETTSKATVYNRLILNPTMHKIALMEIDTPQIKRL